LSPPLGVTTLPCMAPPRSHAELAYYTVADASFFPGVVALLNSLRLAGEMAPLFVVDCGLTTSQKERLSKHTTVIPKHHGLHPQLQKATGPLAHPAELMVVIDADILVTRPLTSLLKHAAEGQIVAFEDDYCRDRFFPEWSSLGLGIPRKQRYVNSGLLVFSATTASEFLPVFVELQERLDPSEAEFGGAAMTDPFYFPDQDILNAMLCTQYEGKATRIEHRLAPVPPFAGIEVTHNRVPLCTYADGVAPYGLHHILKKPWLAKLPANAYSDLLTQVVTSDDSRLKLGVRDLPLRLTGSPLAPIDRWRVSVQLEAHRRFRGKLGLRPAIERRMHQARDRAGSLG
jgi:hypothetical protein